MSLNVSAWNVSAWSIRRPLPTLVIATILAVLGALSFATRPIAPLPTTDVPTISVSVAQSGAAPSDLVAQVTKPVEDALSGLEGAGPVVSSVTEGSSVTIVRFSRTTHADRALARAKEAIAHLRPRLPPTAAEPLVRTVDAAGRPILTYAVEAPDKTADQLSSFIDDAVTRALRGMPGVGDVARIGGVEREVSIVLDPDKLQALGLTLADVSQHFGGVRTDLAGGRAEIGGRAQVIRIRAGALAMDDLGASTIGVPSGGQVRLDDLGVVSTTMVTPTTFARLDGRSVIGFDVMRSQSARDVDVGALVAHKIAKLGAAHPEMAFQLIDGPPGSPADVYKPTVQILIEGAALALLVVFVIFRDLRVTMIVAVALAFSILPAFLAMQVLGVALNPASLLALALSTGLLMQGSIAVIAATKRHMASGASPVRAATEAGEEMGSIATPVDLAIIAVFLLVGLVGGDDPFLASFSRTIAVQLFFSLLAARVLAPMLAAYGLKPPVPLSKTPMLGALSQRYAGVLQWSVRHATVTVAIGLLLFGLTIAGAGFLSYGGHPLEDGGRSLLAIELPPGSPLSATETVTEAIVRRLRTRPEIMSVLVEGGGASRSAAETRKAALRITYVPKAERAMTRYQLELAIGADLATVPDIRYGFLGANGKRDLSLAVTGADAVTVGNVAAELAAQMQRIPTIANVVSSASLDGAELTIRPHLDLARRLGVSTASLSSTLRIATIGERVSTRVAMTDDDRQVPIRVRLDPGVRGDRHLLEQLRVPRADGLGAVALGAVADLSFEQGPVNITRYDRDIQAEIGADLVGDTVVAAAMSEIGGLPIMKSLPPGISVRPAGDADPVPDGTAGLRRGMAYGVLLVFALLVLSFNAVLPPLSVLAPLPLAVGGGSVALLVTRTPLTAPVAIAFLLVLGLLLKAAAMVVHTARLATKTGASRDVALGEAGQKQARPILAATIALLAALLPCLATRGAASDLRSSTAIGMIGGLIAVLPLALVFVPAMVATMDDVGRLCRRAMSRLFASRNGAAGSTGQDSV